MKKNETIAYRLESPFLDQNFSYQLTECEFDEILVTRAYLNKYMEFEENALQLLFALQEFEEFLLSTALTSYVNPSFEYDYFQDSRLKANTKVLGFLNAFTSFKDQFPKLYSLDKSIDIKKTFKKLWEENKVNSVVFSFCIRLRNYSQHQTQPVNKVITGGHWIQNHSVMEQHASVFVKTKCVCQHRNISKKEKQLYLDTFKENADIAAIFRESASLIGTIVEEVRKLVSKDLDHAVMIYEKNLKRGKGNFGEKEVLNVTKISDGAVICRVSIFTDFITRIKKLRLISHSQNAHNHFISNRLRGHEQQSQHFNQEIFEQEIS